MPFTTRWIVTTCLQAGLMTPGFADQYAPRSGAQHVEFTLPAIEDGRPISLEQFRGKKVLLIQFASW